MPDRRTVFFLSDRTGITAEMLGNSLLTQFDDIRFHRVTIPFVDSRLLCQLRPALLLAVLLFVLRAAFAEPFGVLARRADRGVIGQAGRDLPGGR